MTHNLKEEYLQRIQYVKRGSAKKVIFTLEAVNKNVK